MKEYNGVGAGQGRDPRDVSWEGSISGSIAVLLVVIGVIVIASYAMKIARENFPF